MDIVVLNVRSNKNIIIVIAAVDQNSVPMR